GRRAARCVEPPGDDLLRRFRQRGGGGVARSPEREAGCLDPPEDHSEDRGRKTGGTMSTVTLSGTLIEASLRGGLAVAIVGAAALVLRRRSAPLRHALWLGGLACLLAAPLATRLLPPVTVPVLPSRTVAQPAGSSPVAVEEAGSAGVLASAQEEPSAPRRAFPSEALWATLW